MARDYGRIRISIAEDSDFEELGVDAQWLYARVLIPEPSLNYAGVADWRPNRLTPKARDASLERLLGAAHEVEQRRYVLFDLATEEALIRSYIRGDELLKNPKMAVCVAKDYQAVASRILRAAIITELQRIHREHPEYSSWTHKDSKDRLARLLSQPNLETVGYTNQITIPNPVSITNTKPVEIPNRITNPDTSPDTQSNWVYENGPEPQHLTPFTLHPSPNGGYVSPEGNLADASNSEPPPRCPQHLHNPTDAPCRACGIARQAHDRWDTDRRRAAAEAKSEENRRAAELRATAVANCDLCGDDGYRGSSLCDHDPNTLERAQRGMAAVRAALTKSGGDDA